jgi:hypothetical protein
LSRIGKLPIAIPSGVKVTVDVGAVRVEGPKGKLQTAIPAGVKVKVDGNLVQVERESDERKFRALHGLTRKLIANMAQGGQDLPACWKSTASAIAPRSGARDPHDAGLFPSGGVPLAGGVTAAVERQ